MKEFEGKTLKIYLSGENGVVCETGEYIKLENNFLVVRNRITKKLDFISMFMIKDIQIIGEANEEE